MSSFPLKSRLSYNETRFNIDAIYIYRRHVSVGRLCFYIVCLFTILGGGGEIPCSSRFCHQRSQGPEGVSSPIVPDFFHQMSQSPGGGGGGVPSPLVSDRSTRWKKFLSKKNSCQKFLGKKFTSKKLSAKNLSAKKIISKSSHQKFLSSTPLEVTQEDFLFLFF